LKGKRILVTGGTGSLGQALVTRLFDFDPERVVVFSRDENKQHEMRPDFRDVEFLIGDIRDPNAVRNATRDIDVVFNAAALKQVPACEYHPFEAVLTNIVGAENLVRADVETVIGISTDKACLDYHARVEMADGRRVAISTLVREREAASVRTIDGNGAISASTITGWHKNRRAGREMLRVRYEHGARHRGHGGGVLLTGDHPVLTDRGWVRADAITAEHRLITSEHAPNRAQMALLVGTLLGDASVCPAFVRYQRQDEWNRVAAAALVSLDAHLKAAGAGTTLRIRTAAWSRQMRAEFYPDGRKKVPRDLVATHFGGPLLAAWYMDDGTLARGKGNSRPLARFATHGFSRDDVQWLADQMTAHGMAATVQTLRPRQYRPYYELRLTADGSERLFEIVAPYIVGDHRHKLPDWAQPFDSTRWALGAAVPFLGRAIVERVDVEARDVYCLDVADSHNFAVGGVVVHNCKPVNVMGMTKALQERVFIQANLRSDTRFTCVRYGNVIGSRGSVIPLFREQIRRGGPVTVTDRRMTRFMLTLDQAVDTVLAAAQIGRPGEVLVPDAPSSLVTDIATALIAGKPVDMVITGIRPGEKIHEIMVSDDEALRTASRDRWFAIQPMLPELQSLTPFEPALTSEFSSAGPLLTAQGTRILLERSL